MTALLAGLSALVLGWALGMEWERDRPHRVARTGLQRRLRDMPPRHVERAELVAAWEREIARDEADDDTFLNIMKGRRDEGHR